MAGRRLGPDERALWRRVTETVRPLAGGAVESPLPVADGAPASVDRLRPAPTPGPSLPAGKGARTGPGETLDGGWDRRLRRGLVLPERTIDLHGHTLSSAYAALDLGLDRALADGVRVLLLVTGRPPRADRQGRGLIRASIGDWLAGSRHAGRIAAVRNAHPRHGGAGALYLILRRPKGD